MSEILIKKVPLTRVYAAFQLTKILAHETAQPGMGYCAQYSSGKFGEATIFIYDRGSANVPDGPKSEAVLDEFRRAAADVHLAYPEAKLAARSIVATSAREDSFVGAEFLLGAGGEQCNSFLLLTGIRGSYFKIRLTLKPEIHTYDPMGDFVEAVAAGIWAH